MSDRNKLARGLDPADFTEIFDLCDRMGSPLTVYDTETSGFVENPQAEILEIAFLAFDVENGADVIRFGHSLVRNRFPIPQETIDLNGIDAAMCMRDGLPWPEVWGGIREWFEGRVVSGFNSRSYDTNMLRKQHALYDLDHTPFDELDVREIHMDISGQRRGRLTDLCNQKGIPVIDAHQAMADVIMTSNLLIDYIRNLGVERVAGYRKSPPQTGPGSRLYGMRA